MNSREARQGVQSARRGLSSALPLLNVDPPCTQPLRGLNFYCSWAAANIDGQIRVLA